jgi:hypothetical protein
MPEADPAGIANAGVATIVASTAAAVSVSFMSVLLVLSMPTIGHRRQGDAPSRAAVFRFGRRAHATGVVPALLCDSRHIRSSQHPWPTAAWRNRIVTDCVAAAVGRL